MLIRQTTAAVLVVLASHGCAFFGRYIYHAETRVEPPVSGELLSEADLERAESVAAFVAEKCRLRTVEEEHGTIEGDDMVSAMKTPPRELLTRYTRKVHSPGRLAISLRLEVSEDRRTLYFTAVDPERGEPSNFLNCIREGVKAMVEREFQGMSIVHEVKVIGPVYTD